MVLRQVQYALVEARGVDVELRVNGCPALRVESTGNVASSVGLADLLVHGTNEVELVRLAGGGSARAFIGACSYGAEPDPANDTACGGVVLREAALDPRRASAAIAIADQSGPWPWLSAERLDPEVPALRHELLGFLRGVEGTLARNDHAGLYALLEQRLVERSVAYGRPSDEAGSIFRQITADADFSRFEALSEAELEVLPCFGGRALWLRRRGSEALYAAPDGDWELALCVARVDGALRAVRS